MHCRIFELLGAVPVPCDLKEAIEKIKSGEVDAQENPLANTVTYGVHKAHRYHTLTGHCYLSRGLYGNRAQIDSWPQELQAAMDKAVREAVAVQRRLAVEEEEIAQKEAEAAGCEVIELTRGERETFVKAVKPLYDEARKRFGNEMFAMIGK
jgi:TRAP-type C4-dicarboxylate transport system substrate-binding protein